MRSTNLTRRSFMKAVGLGAASLVVSCSMFEDVPHTSSTRPNIILIMADDLGYECLGCNGSLSYKTPRLDDIASKGMRFTNCHSQPLCTPSRVQIMTGKYNHRNYTRFGALDPGETTFGHIMQNAGYKTCCVGKWQLSGEQEFPGSSPEHAGFDKYCLWQVGKEAKGSRYWNPKIIENGKYRDDLEGRYGPDVFLEYIENYIERNKTQPFFLYYPMALTHGPQVPTPDSAETGSGIKANRKYFADMVAYMDKIIGRIVEETEAAGIAEDTLLLFTGDNGTAGSIVSKLGDREIKGGKGKTTDAGTHVPLIAYWKGVILEGNVCEDLVDFSDILPTIVETAGAALPGGSVVDGRSFLPQLRGKKGNPREWIFCFYDKKKGAKKKTSSATRLVRDNQWKLYNDGRLFDVIADPLEEHAIEPGSSVDEVEEIRKQFQTVLDSMK